MSFETFLDEDGNSETVWVKEEPDCHECSDRGFVWVDADGQPTGFDIDAVPVEQVPCPDCNPTAEQVAARFARLADRAVTITGEEAPY